MLEGMLRRMVAASVLGVLVLTAAGEKKPKPVEQPPAHVGVVERVFHPKAVRNGRGAEKQELHVMVWYPAPVSAVEVPQVIGPPDTPLFEAGMAAPNAPFAPALRSVPMIVLSHGTGGSKEQMAWLGTGLARAGFIAVAVDHPGNNSHEAYTAEGFALWWERATDLSEVIDAMLADENFGPKIDKDRIGSAGFSIGGYTVMEIAGAQTDFSVLLDRCAKQPDQIVCHVPEMKNMATPQQMLAQVRKTSGASLAASAESYKDARIHAVFAIAPALGFTLTQESLHAIREPVEIVVGDADPIAPANENADYIRANVRGARETVLPGGVSHYTFLDTCTALGKKQIGVYCADAPGVDRYKVHEQVAGQAVEFFERALRLK
jgi:predicted dienelactone hydrolase